MHQKALVLLTLWLSALAVLAEDVSFTASAPQLVTVGHQFRVDYTLNHEGRDLQVPSMEDFDVLMGPSTSRSSSVQWINGKMTSSTQLRYTFVLLASKTGTFTLAPASITVDGKKYSTQPLTIKVIDEGQQGAAAAQGGAQQGAASGASAASASSATKTDQVFVRTQLSKSQVYEQEAVCVTYKLYTRYDIRDFSNVKFPEYQGFYVQDIDLDANQQRQWLQEEYNGVLYSTLVLKQCLLFPQHSGKMDLEGGKMDAIIRLRTNNRSRSVFDNFFDSYQEVRKTLTIPAARLEVKALPKPAPQGFSDAVGQFTMKSEISKTDLDVNDAVTVKVVISGNGNLKLVKPLDIRFPDDFEIYDPKVETNVKTGASGLSGSKATEYVAIPRFGGDFEIPAARFVYFDTREGRYKELSTPVYSLHVMGSAGETKVVAPSGNTGTVKQSVRNLGSDIRYIPVENDLQYGKQPFFRSWGYWLLYVLPALAFVVLLVVLRRQARENADLATRKNKRANKLAKKRLRMAEACMKKSDAKGFYEEAMHALWGYVADKLNIPAASLTKDNVREILLAHQSDEALADDFLDTLSACEFARFAPGADSGQSMQTLFDRAVNLITQMEEKLK